MMNRSKLLGLAVASTLAGFGCGDKAPATDSVIDAAPIRAPQLGDGNPGSVALTEIVTSNAGLNIPRDLAFNPLRPNALWVVNFGDDSVVIVHDVLAETIISEWRKDAAANHFMAKPSSIAFGANDTTVGAPGTFATCQESRNTYDDTVAPNDFMGPALWSSDLSIFAMEDPNGLGSHLDMLHNSPLCMGAAHETANVYWTFSGRNGSIVKYDFRVDNGIGQDDHSDGQSWRYGFRTFGYVPGVPSHLVFDSSDASLYIADTANSRIAKLDTRSGTPGVELGTKEPMDL